ncbi:MAG: NUDIX domain-containing protein [Planctomycetales bacterium]|nr:NUDIX domain-containing protein [Planctomycetales bacterium]
MSGMNWPRYCCAIVETERGEMLFERRSAVARLAAGKLTCFGGARETDEEPEACLRRELREELGWEPSRLEFRVALWVAGELIAWFYVADLDGELEKLRPSTGHTPLVVSLADLELAPLSPWHRAAIEAYNEGRSRVDLPV